MRLLWLVVAGLGAIVALGAWLLLAPCHRGPSRQALLQIRPGARLGAVADSLVALGLLESPLRLKLAARLTGLDRGIQPGLFTLDSRMSPLALLEVLQTYAVPSRRLRMPEGARLEDLAALAADSLGLDSLQVVELGRDRAFVAGLGLSLPSLDGALFPDTYTIGALEDERALLERLAKRFQEVFAELAPAAVRDTLDLQRLLTLASIVQAEYQLPGEADTIAAVYSNRLARGMRLQADPTVQFLLPDGPRRLTLDDLEIESPWNTYLHKGLPPGPIGSPGRIALAAALQPARCDYLYFVARGDGSHAFAKTHDEHLENRRPLDALRRRLARERRAAGQP